MYICFDESRRGNAQRHVADAAKYRMEKMGLSVFSTRSSDESAPDMLLCDVDYNGITTFIRREEYILIVLTPGLLTNVSMLPELDIIQKLFQSGKIKVYVILRQLRQEEIPKRLLWVRKALLYQKEDMSDIYEVSLEIASQFWRDRAGSQMDVIAFLDTRLKGCDVFVNRLKVIYQQFESCAVRERMIVLVVLYHYLLFFLKKSRLPERIADNAKCVEGMKELLYEGRDLSKRELISLHSCMVDMLKKL